MTAVIAAERRPSTTTGSIENGISLARRLDRPALLTLTERLPAPPAPLAFLAASSGALGGGVYWEQPRDRVTFAGAGSALTIRANGRGRFGEVLSAVRGLPERLVRDDDDARFPILGGFAFDTNAEPSSLWSAFPDALLVVPRVLVQIDGDDALIRVTLQVDPGSPASAIEEEMDALLADAYCWLRAPKPLEQEPLGVRTQSLPSQRTWESTVATAVSLIRQRMLDKVVLAREERLLAGTPFSPVSTLSRLRAADPDATLFAVQSGGDWFAGASPERLVRLDNGLVDGSCLAGSVSAGQGDEEQRRQAQWLLASDKDREEHEIVVASTMRALAEVCEDVTRLPGTPRVVSARSVLHLETPITGRLSAAGHVLDLVERLHPTPAVGGHPREIALSVIRELEEIDRGWYAGPIGWTDLDGYGEFAVAIRSAFLSGRTAALFAGCGIVAGSVPADEFEESRLKLRPMLSALGAM